MATTALPPPPAAVAAGAGPTTQQLLDSLQQARTQKQQNEALRGIVLDNEALVVKLHGQYNTQKQKAEITRCHKKASELLVALESGLSFRHLRKLNVPQYLKECDQRLSGKDFIPAEQTANLTDLETSAQALKALKGCGCASEYYSSLIESGTRLMEKSLGLLKDSKLHSKQWAAVMEPVLVLLKDVMAIAPISDCLVEKEEEVHRMKFNVDECTQAQAKAIMEGEMQEAEALYYQKIKLQEVLGDLIKQKFAVLDGEEEGALTVPMRRVHETHSRANAEMAALLQDRERVRKECEEDLQRLSARLAQCRAEDLAQTTAFNDEKEKSNEYLRLNLARQEECWRQIEQLERELQKLSADRGEEVRRRVQAIERNERRRVDFENFVSFAENHESLLRLTISNCEIAEEVTDTVDEFISSACNTIERRMRETEKEMEKLRVDVHNEYFHAFREMYLTLGDLSYKKEKHLTEMQKKIEYETIQQEFCMETFNPKAKEHSQAKKQLTQRKAEMEDQLAQLRTRSQLYIEWFQPSEKALIEAGVEFTHPVDELVQINESRNNKLVEYHELMTAEEDPDEEYAAEMAEIERLRQLAAVESRTLARLTAGPNASTPKTPYGVSTSQASSAEKA
eukprot:RCo019547